MRLRRRAKRPDIRAGLVLSADDLDLAVPEAIVKIFLDGWTTHVPLNHLTDAAVAQTTGVVVENPLYVDLVSNTLKSASKDLDASGEDKLTVAEFKQAWPRLLQLIRKYLYRHYYGWLDHFTRIDETEGAYGANFPKWRLYDILVRRRALTNGLDPSQLQTTILEEAVQTFNSRCAAETLQAEFNKRFPPPPPPPQRTGSRHASNSTSRHTSDSFRAGAVADSSFAKDVLLCHRCGRRSHTIDRCTASTCPDGSTPQLAITTEPQARDAGGKEYCRRFSLDRQCRFGTKCDYAHTCTLCNATEHGTVNCPRAKGSRRRS